ncbi:MAG: LacI family DNA-binding transcriptional regulator [Anaerolineales bacterium]
MPKRVTVADVARTAGVSMMTVSRAINGTPGVSPGTRRAILKIAKKIGYHPSGVARALATRRTRTIGLLIPDITNPFFSELARGAEDYAYQHGYGLFLVNTDEDPQREEGVLASLREKQVDGLVWCSSRLEQTRLKHWSMQFPRVVLVNRRHAGVASINVDDEDGARRAVAFFAGGGRRNIAFFAGPSHSFSSQRRLAGYRAGLDEAGIPFKPGLAIQSTPNYDGGVQALTFLSAGGLACDAVLTYNDLVAVGAVQACKKFGLHVPRDLAFIGFDDIPMAALVSPQLSTLRIDKRAMGARAVEALIASIDGATLMLPQETLLASELILRETTP